MKSAGPPKCLGAVIGLSLLVLLGTYYMESVQLPQDGLASEQTASINDLQDTVSKLRKDDTALRQRLQSLETILRQVGVSPSDQLTAALRGSPALATSAPTSAAAVAGPLRWREDLHCGKPWTVEGGATAECNPAGDKPCCAPSGWCGGSVEHCVCTDCIDFRFPGRSSAAAPPSKNITTTASSALWRKDMRCGAQSPINGKAAQCDPSGDSPCCGLSGWCGSTSEHCTCQGCQDFRPVSMLKSDIKDYSVYRSKRIALVVPFRDREMHIEGFRKRIQSHAEAWAGNGIKHDWWIFVVEQFDNNHFNRGYLFNVGFQNAMEVAKKDGKPFDCVVMHDIDIIPEPVVDYGFCPHPNQLSGEIECWSWSVPYPDNVGGVVSLSPKHWKDINGFSNEYEGWGGEDDDLYLRLKQNSLLKGGCHTFCKQPPKVPVVYRPPLGKGRFNCMHDGDHTPRQRAPDASAMWSKLDAMKKNSKRWTTDGLASLKVHSAAPPITATKCEQCDTSEGGGPKRLYSEHWSRVSSRAINTSNDIGIGLLDGGNCTKLLNVPVAELLQGLAHLRSRLPKLFPTECNVKQAWAMSANFVLVDVTLGQTMLVGDGAGWAAPDASLPSLKSAEVDVTARAKDAWRRAGNSFLQGRRLIRWIRLLPPSHRGLVLATGEPLELIRDRFVREMRQMPQISPACVSKAKLKGGGDKYRLTAGSQWCGDQGWDNLEFFHVLRSLTTVPKEKLVPICVSMNEKVYTYRFENSEGGCVGTHSSGTTWSHVTTLHSSKDASGDRICVGVDNSGPKTSWAIRKMKTCDFGKYKHSFGFAAMHVNQHVSPLLHACLLSNTLVAAGSEGDAQILKRLAVGAECLSPPKGWKQESELEFLATQWSTKDSWMCAAHGESDSTSGALLWRFFWGAPCKQDKLSTNDDKGSPIKWTISQEASFYVPEDAGGVLLCLCHGHLSSAGAPPSRWMHAAGGSTEPLFSWFEGHCPQHMAEEVCLRDLSGADILRYSYLMNA